jgi:hypothetical protein
MKGGERRLTSPGFLETSQGTLKGFLELTREELLHKVHHDRSSTRYLGDSIIRAILSLWPLSVDETQLAIGSFQGQGAGIVIFPDINEATRAWRENQDVFVQHVDVGE